MAKVTVHPTPSDEVVAKACVDDMVVDAKGRSLKIKQPDVLQESRLVRVIGEAAMNTAYMTGYVLPAAMVVEIDGDAIPFPSSVREVEAQIVRLGRDGMAAVLAHFAAQAKQAPQQETHVKN